METSQNLHDHESSFSHGWTASRKPSMVDQLDNASLGHSFNTQDAASFIEMDPDVFSMRWPSSYHTDFTLPCAQSLDLVDADQIFSDGVITTSQMDPAISSFERSVSTDSTKSFLYQRNQSTLTEMPRPVSANSSPMFYSAQSTPFLTGRRSVKAQRKSPLMRSCSESSKKLFLRYMCFLLPLYRKVKQMQLFSGKSSCRKSASTTSSAAPSRRLSLNSVEWCHGNADTAVYDAILYCKRSIGQDL
ncbi:hypothetical protein LUZ62_058083 [Rhynchospora pubera]|uniref:Membrane-associated kinase regulator 6 n=1 Tax=Rhynchospora pubera TaxID=906938 RepID=A0AAV8E2Z8_9POAL|nr:hypothetical protein LUZ62_058083 [Rhynchospora pubera]